MERDLQQRLDDLEKKVEGLTTLVGDLMNRILALCDAFNRRVPIDEELHESVTKQARLLNEHLKWHLDEMAKIPINRLVS